jgi:hypothetical protein
VDCQVRGLALCQWQTALQMLLLMLLLMLLP